MELEPFGTSLRGLRFFAAVALGFKLILTGLAAREPGENGGRYLWLPWRQALRDLHCLKPDGLLLMDRPFRSLDHPEPQWPETEADKANAWLKAWSDL